MREITAVIPALNAQATLHDTIMSISGRVTELVVSDGGSTDGTQSLASKLGAVLVEGPPGRGGQLRRGAELAKTSWLLFLHADTRLAADWIEKSEIALGGATERAGYFRFTLDDADPKARRLESLVAWRSRALGLPYGDQGLLISRVMYNAIGGFRDLAMMEDVDMVRRIGRRNMVAIDAQAITSAVRFQRDGYWRRSARNVTCLGLYALGVSPATIKRIYG